MDALLLCFLKLLLFSVFTKVSMGQPTAQSSCPYEDNNCDGLPHVILEHNFKINNLGTVVRDLLSWKDVIQSQYNKEITTLKNKSSSQEKSLTALKNECTSQKKEIAGLNNKSSLQEMELTSQKHEITALKNESSSQKQEITALGNEVHELYKKIASIYETKQDLAENCADVYKFGVRMSGVYNVSIRDAQQVAHKVPVYCDMDTTTGGWTIFQRRQDGSVSFDKNWEEYKTGFGHLQSEFWLGNQWLAMLTASKTKYRLRVDLESFDNEKRYAEYEDFKISNEADKYRLNIGSYSGTAGDGGVGLSYHNQMQFSTKECDNDEYSSNCARNRGGFWYKNCANANINGVYRHAALTNDINGINWVAWLRYTTLKHTEMKLKPMQ